jgi:hypothetical protein
MGREKKTLLDAEKTVDAVNSHCAHLRIFLVFRYLDSKYRRGLLRTFKILK